MEIKWSLDHLISRMGFPLWVIWYFIFNGVPDFKWIKWTMLMMMPWGPFQWQQTYINYGKHKCFKKWVSIHLMKHDNKTIVIWRQMTLIWSDTPSHAQKFLVMASKYHCHVSVKGFIRCCVPLNIWNCTKDVLHIELFYLVWNEIYAWKFIYIYKYIYIYTPRASQECPNELAGILCDIYHTIIYLTSYLHMAYISRLQYLQCRSAGYHSLALNLEYIYHFLYDYIWNIDKYVTCRPKINDVFCMACQNCNSFWPSWQWSLLPMPGHQRPLMKNMSLNIAGP